MNRIDTGVSSLGTIFTEEGLRSLVTVTGFLGQCYWQKADRAKAAPAAAHK